LSLFDCGHNK